MKIDVVENFWAISKRWKSFKERRWIIKINEPSSVQERLRKWCETHVLGIIILWIRGTLQSLTSVFQIHSIARESFKNTAYLDKKNRFHSIIPVCSKIFQFCKGAFKKECLYAVQWKRYTLEMLNEAKLFGETQKISNWKVDASYKEWQNTKHRKIRDAP